jgi:hypothetical protein
VIGVLDDGLAGMAAARRAARWRQAKAGASCLAALAIAIVAGMGAGRAIAPGQRVEPAAVSVIHAGAATLVVPREWRTVASRGTGVPGKTAVFESAPGLPDRVIVTIGPIEDASLVPRALRGLVRDLGRGPHPTSLAGYRAWRYGGLPGRNQEDVVDLTVLPTGAGALGVACISAAWATSAGANCASSIRSVSISHATMFVPSQDLALRLRLARVLPALDRARLRSRSALSSAHTGVGQARSARRLAREHLAAADALRPVAGPQGGPLLDELSNVAAAYSVLGRAASAGSARRFHAARAAVATAEARLALAIDRLTPHDAREPVVTRPAPSTPRPPATGSSDGSRNVVVVVVIVGLLAAGLWLGMRGAPARAASRIARREFIRPNHHRSAPAGSPARRRAELASREPASWSDAPSPSRGKPKPAPSAGWDAPPARSRRQP